MLSMSVVLKSPAADQELVTRVGELILRLHQDTGLDFTYSDTQVDEFGTRVLVWTEAHDPDQEIRLVLDDVAGTRYVSASAPDDERRQWLFERLREHFGGASLEELREAVQREGQADPAAYLRLALGLNNVFDELSLALIREGLASPVLAIRGSAAEAAAMLHWPQLADAVAAALERETDANVASVLTVAAQLCWSSAQSGTAEQP